MEENLLDFEAETYKLERLSLEIVSKHSDT